MMLLFSMKLIIDEEYQKLFLNLLHKGIRKIMKLFCGIQGLILIRGL